MQYSFEKVLTGDFQTNLEKLRKAIPEAGFGIIFENNMKDSFKMKLDLDFRNYMIIGVCAPSVANKLVNLDDNIGVFLPCNIVLQELADDKVKVSVAQPTKVLQPANNAEVLEIVAEPEAKLKKFLEDL